MGGRFPNSMLKIEYPWRLLLELRTTFNQELHKKVAKTRERASGFGRGPMSLFNERSYARALVDPPKHAYAS